MLRVSIVLYTKHKTKTLFAARFRQAASAAPSYCVVHSKGLPIAQSEKMSHLILLVYCSTDRAAFRKARCLVGVSCQPELRPTVCHCSGRVSFHRSETASILCRPRCCLQLRQGQVLHSKASPTPLPPHTPLSDFRRWRTSPYGRPNSSISKITHPNAHTSVSGP